jgi:hypothetical protein
LENTIQLTPWAKTGIYILLSSLGVSQNSSRRNPSQKFLSYPVQSSATQDSDLFLSRSLNVRSSQPVERKLWQAALTARMEPSIRSFSIPRTLRSSFSFHVVFSGAYGQRQKGQRGSKERGRDVGRLAQKRSCRESATWRLHAGSGIFKRLIPNDGTLASFEIFSLVDFDIAARSQSVDGCGPSHEMQQHRFN